MCNNSAYNSIIQAKNGTFIPVFTSNKTVESRYNPENSCDLILNSITKSGFFVVTGIASGILIKKITEKFPECRIIGIEYSKSDIEFLNQLETINELSKNPNVTFCSIDELSSTLINSYLPAMHGDFQLIQQKPWLLEKPDLNQYIPEIINSSLKKISADYSVQSHFGKRWQKNIHTNLKLIDKKTLKNQTFETSKTAAVIAAGPSFDKTINKLKNNREKYFIIATDTAYSALIRNNIIPEAVVSIDGQLLSYNHFINIAKNTHFYFDLCGNSAAVKHVLKKSDNIHYFISGHPFCNFVNDVSNNAFPFIYTGSGTVTISALDLALKSGFNKIEIFGADFAYLNGKSYTKGTYLDSLYTKSSGRIKTTETTYDKLIFRIPVKKIGLNSYSTDVLSSYKLSLEEYLQSKNCKFIKENDIYFIENKNILKPLNFEITFNYKNFIQSFNSLQNIDLQTYLLPLIANLRKSKPDESFENLLKLARTIVVSYN